MGRVVLPGRQVTFRFPGAGTLLPGTGILTTTMEHCRCSDHHDAPSPWLRTGLVMAEAAGATAQPHPDIAVLETIALGYDPRPRPAEAACPGAYAAPAPARSAAVDGLVRPIASGPIASGPIASRAYRQPSAGATWVRMLSMAWAL